MTIYTISRGMIIKHKGVKLDKNMKEIPVEYFEAVYHDEERILRIKLADTDKTKLLETMDIEVKQCSFDKLNETRSKDA